MHTWHAGKARATVLGFHLPRQLHERHSVRPANLRSRWSLSVGSVSVWTLGRDRFRVESPDGVQEVEGIDQARQLAHELAELDA
jgi:hypothetical protein